ncbi:helix-turn-helix transcriptional regulator [Microbacterium sp. NEAU-LLC]|uniref:Helix-turn-helix transcriptional regulator n=1 Tax=Microbacterium helvum TaxID=2773713 RepID=A0ABR8NSU2_9MICO|nr:helix-turn-helix transcriptional regulator [Microbacterium helvum]MBD3942802.1 helix-turn-helix transcriptional regulator [Microbacterium helvum]
MKDRESLEAYEHAVGQAIRLRRMTSGLSQSELADRLSRMGFSMMQTTVAKIEAGTRPLRLSEFVGIAHALGMPWQSLLAEPSPMIHGDVPIAEMESYLATLRMVEESMRKDMLTYVSDWAEARAERLAAEQRFQDVRDGAAADPAE